MKKLILILALVSLVVSGCGWYSFCDPKSPDYNPQLCQQRLQEAQLMEQMQQTQYLQQIHQQQVFDSIHRW
jgi:hypothetical protein